MRKFDFLNRVIKGGVVACVLMLAGLQQVAAQMTVTINSGTIIANQGATYNISTGTAGTFTNNGVYMDTTSPGAFNVTGPFTFSGTGTTTTYNFNINSGASVLGSLVSVYNTATIGSGASLATGSGNLDLRTDLPLYYSTANLVDNGVLTGTVQGLVVYATATTGCGPFYTPTLSTNISGAVVQYQWESSPDSITWTALGGATNATYVPSVTAPVYYHVITTTTNSSFTNTTPAVKLNFTPVPSSISGTSALCVGTTVAFTDPTAGGIWTASNGNVTVGSSSGIVNAVSPGTVTVSYSTGCAPDATVAVTVTSTPGTITGTFSVCAGGTTATTTTLGCTPSGGAWSYSAGTGTASVGSATGVVTGLTAGTVNISYSFGPSCSSTQEVTVNPTPTVSLSPSTAICIGNNTTLAATGATSYSWTPSATLSSSTAASVTATPTGTTIYTVAGSYLSGCSDRSTVTVTVNPLPTVSVVSNEVGIVCGGTPVALTASGSSTSYSWSPNTNLSATTGTTVSATPYSTQVYTVIGTDVNTCQKSASVTVTVNPSPSIVSSSAHFCTGGFVALSVTGGTTYTWAPATGLTSTTASMILANPVATTVYSVSSTNGLGCTTTLLDTVTVYPYPVITTSPSLAICNGSSTTLTASGATTYTWYGSSYLSTTTGSSTVATPPSTTTIGVFGTANGCSAGATIDVTVNPVPVTTVTPTSTTVCAGGTTILTAGGATTYSWSPATGLSSTTGAAVSASPFVTTVYTVTGANGYSCTSTAVTTINVTTSPTISAGPGVAICTGSSTPLTASGASVYSWSPSTGLSATTGATVSANPTTTTTYTVTGTVGGGCTGIGYVTVTVNPAPTVVASAGTGICTGSSTSLTASGATTYSWAPGTALSATTGTTVTANPVSTTTYTITGTSLGCTSTAFTTVTVNSLPSVVGSPSIAICAGSSGGSISAGGATSYTWSPSAGLGATTGVSVYVNPTVTTTYTVTGTNGSGCSNTATITITVNPAPTVLASGGGTLCSGVGTVGISASGASSYTWAPASSVTCSNCASTTAAPTSSTTYTVTGTSAGCQGTATVFVSVNPTPTISAGPGVASCAGNPTTLTATGGATYTWAPGASLNSTTGFNVTATPTVTTTYTITGTSAAGCVGTGTVTVSINALPTVLGSPSIAICSGGSGGSISAIGATSYTWAPSAGLSATTGASVGVNPTTTTTYTVTGTNGTGCSNTATITITVNPTPIVSTAGGGTICPGGSVGVSASGATTYSWSPSATLSAATGAAVTASPTVTTTYSVTGTTGSCSSTSTSIITVSVNSTPTVTISGVAAICQGGNTALNASGAVNYTWAPAITLNSSTGISVTAMPSVTTTYTVTGTAGTGCTGTGMMTVSVNPVPSAITSGTDGIISTVAGNGSFAFGGDGGAATAADFAGTINVAVDGSGNIYICDYYNNRIRKVNTAGIVSTVAGNGSSGYGGDGVAATATSITQPQGVAVDNSGNIYIAEYGNDRIRKVNTAGIISTVAGNGSHGYGGDGVAATATTLDYPYDVAVDGSGNIYIADLGNSRIRKVNTAGIISTVAGNGSYGYSGDGVAATATDLNDPVRVAVDGSGNIYIADYGNNRIRKVNTAGIISTVAGNGSGGYGGDGVAATATGLYDPYGVAVDGSGDIYIADFSNNRIRKVNTAGIISTVAGNGTGGYGGDGVAATSTELNAPNGVALDGSGNIYIADFGNSRIRKVTEAPSASTVCVGATITVTDAAGGGTWSSTSSNVSIVGSTGVVTGVSAGTAEITYTVPTGCSITTIVTINALPTVSATGGSFCTGSGPVGISASGAVTYTWSPSATLSASTGSGVNANPVSTAVYTVTGTDSLGCANTATATVSVNPIPTISAGSDVTICSGTNTTLSASGGVSYSWSPSADLSASTGTSPIASPTTTTTYTVTGTGAGGCQNTATVMVSVNPSPAITTSGSIGICNGANTSLTASGATTYTWSPSGSLSSSVGSPVTASPTSTTTYTVTGNNGTCSNTATLTVTVNALPTVSAGTGAQVCAGYSASLSATGAATYTWSPAGTLSASTGASVLANPSGTTTYSVTGSNGTCSNTASVTVTVNPLPTPSFTSAPGAADCAGSNTVYTTQSGGGIGSYVWTLSGTPGTTYSIISGGTGSGNSTVTLDWNVTGSQIVTVNYTDINGCTGLLPASNTTSVNPTPLAITGATTVCPGTTALVSEASPGGTWSSNNTSLATIGSGTGIITGIATGNTTVSYTFNTTGCYATSPLTINPLPATISGSAFLCQGQTTTLADATTGGTWTSATPSIATISSGGLVTAISPGTVEITYTLPTSCSVSFWLVVNPLPSAITGTFGLCNGTATTLADATSGGGWSSSATAVATIDTASGLLTSVSVGNSTITYTLGTGCYATQQVSVNTIPVVAAISGTTTMCLGSGTTLTDVTPSGTWSSSTTGVATISGGAVSSVSAGTATISYTVTSGGCSNFVTQAVTVNPVPSAITGNVPVCIGGSVTLADAVTGGTWASGSTGVATIGSTTGVVASVTPGNSTITYTLPAGCSTTASVTINALPVVAAISGGTNACAGQTATLTDVTPSGVWSSSNSSVASIGTDGVVNAVAAGAVTITYTVTNGTSCTSYVIYGFTVNPVPAAISGSLALCTGATTGLSDITAGGTWSSGTTATATIVPGTGVVSAMAPGTTMITYALTTGCSATTNVTVNSIPATITGTLNVCVGLTTTLATSPAGGTWSSSNTGEATVGSTGIVTGAAAGTPTITYTLTGGCYNTQQITVNALPSAISGVASACAGSSSTLTDIGGGSWSSGTTSVADVTSGVVTALTAGNSVITYTLPTGCSTTRNYTVNPMPSAIAGVASVCPGNTTTLGSSPAGGTWSSSNSLLGTVSTSGVVTGVATGMPTITYMLAAGCYVTQAVTVNPVPSAILGSLVVCSGATTGLSDFGGGTWSSGSPSVAAIVSSTGVVTGGLSGNATITYTLPTTGCTTTAVVTVNPLPSAIGGTAAVCSGLTTTLTATPAGGSWSSSNTGEATVIAGVVTGASAGTPTITYTLGTGCISTIPVTVNPLPAAIGGTANVCSGLTTALTDITPGGTWSSNTTSVAAIVGSTGVVTGGVPGTATITYTLPTGCLITAPFTVNSTPAPISGVTSVCVGASTTLGSSPAGGTWSSSNTLEASVSGSVSVSGVSAGTPVISYVLGTGCMAATTVTVNPLPAAITGTPVVCTGNAVTLSSATTGGTWSSGSTSVATISTAGLLSGLTTGNSLISYTLPTGCSTSVTATVNRTPSALTGSLAICQGMTTILGSTPLGGSWTSSNTTEAITLGHTITGVGAGTPTISYTISSTGCFNTAVVTVNALPAAITGPSSVCTGSTASLFDATTGGTWTSSDSTVGSFASSTSGVVSGNLAGSVTITYTLPTTCSITTPFTVNPNPAAITGAGAVCPGSTITLADTTSGGSWSSSNTSEAVVGSTGIVTGVTAGTPTITYTLPAGCTATTGITVNAAPDVSVFTAPSASSQCVGLPSTVTLNSSTLGTDTYTVAYTLSGANSGAASLSVAMVSGVGSFIIPDTVLTNTGVTTVTINTITNTTGCNTTLTTGNASSFNVNPLPVVFAVSGGGSYCSGSTGLHVFLSGSATGVNYQLSISGVPVGSPVAGTSSSIDFGAFTTAGLYTVVATNAATGCSSNMSGSATVSVNALPVAQTVSGGGAYCVGGTGLAVGLLSSQGGVSYQLYNGGIATGTAATGSGSAITFGLQTAAGTYTVIGTDTTTLCTNAMSGLAVVTVNPLPSAITGTMVICAGQTTTLGSATSGGTWTSGTIAVAGIDSSSGLVTAGIAGTSVITYTLPTTCSVNAVVTVNTLPTAITGLTGVCVGNTLTLGSTPAGGTWSSSNTALATMTGNTLNAISAGNPIISYVLGTGCMVTATATVNPMPLPISGTSSVCVGSTGLAFDATLGGTWASCNTAIVTISSATGVMTGVSAGPVSCINYTLPTGCSVSAPFTVNPAPAAITGTFASCVGGSTTLANTVSGGTWSSSNPSTASIGSTGVVSALAAGVVTISYTLPAGCYTTATYTVVAGAAAITGTPVVCNGLTTSLADATPSGTWTVSSGGFATVSTSGMVTGANAGTATITYTIAGGCYTTLPITVNPLPAAITGTASVCAGLATTLSTTTTGGTWSSSNTAEATVVAGVVTGISGTPTITYTLPTGCLITRQVTVNPLPAAITGTTTVCAGLNVTLADATAGGTWSNIGSSVATITGTTGIVTGVGAGTTSVSYTLSATGCAVGTIVSVNAAPAAISGSPVICIGATATLTDAVSGGNWSSSNTLLATVGTTTGVVTGINPGNPVITYTLLPSGCSVSMLASVNPSPAAITGTLAICPGAVTTLLDGTFGGTWSSTGSATINATSGVVTGVAAGTAAITYTLPTGCTANAVVTVNPLPAAISGSSTVCIGSSISLTDATSGGTWTSSNTTATVGSASGSVTGIASGTPSIIYTVLSTGCMASLPITVNPLPSSIMGTTTLCVGAVNTLSDATSGGAWSSSDIAVSSINPTGGLITGVGPGSVIYTYTLPTGCIATTTGVVNALPALFTVTGGGTYCAGGSGVHIALSGSSAGISYQLFNGLTPAGSALAGTGSPLDFGLILSGGTYTVVATNTATGCTQTMTGSATVAGSPLPAVFIVTGGGSYCAGGTGVHVFLSGSATGINYQLLLGTTPVSLMSGTGGSLDFGAVTAAGNYTVVAINTATSCTINMSGTATIIINPLPTAFSVTGGGSYCTGGTGVHVGLSGSSIGVSYQLFNGTGGIIMTGTGSSLDFGPITTLGTYTIVATATTGCTAGMSGSTTIAINTPPVAVTVTSSGSTTYCAGGTPPHIGLATSTSGISYQLYNGLAPVGTPVIGGGSTVDFGSVAAAGAYTVIATNTATGCTATMTGIITITITPLPTVYSVTGGGGMCSGGSALSIGLSGSTSGVTYTLYNGTTVMATSTGGGSSFNFGSFSTATTYTATATSGSCVSAMSGSATITTNPLPTTYTVSGGGGYCTGGSGLLISLAGSQSGINYQLNLTGTGAIGTPVAGTGASIGFGYQTTAGIYTVSAVNTSTGCSATMTGSTTIAINALPAAYTVTVSGGGTYCSGGSGDSVGVSNSQTGVSYQLFNGSLPSGPAVNGISGTAVSFGTRTTAGSYNVVATNITTGCTSAMTGSVTISVVGLPAVYTMTGGGAFCAGGTGLHVGLGGSQTGVDYLLYNGGISTGISISGTGSSLDFGLMATSGTYTAVASDTGSACASYMSGSSIIIINALPTAFNVTGGGSYCSGGTGVHVGLDGSTSGISYQLYVGSTPVGGALSGTGGVLDFGLVTAGGSYTVVATNTATTCSATMTGATTVTVNSLPMALTVTVSDGGSYCTGGAGVSVGMSSTEVGVSYQLYNGFTLSGSPVTGTGAAVNFGLRTDAGTYTVIATNGTSCERTMANSISISINPLPVAYNVTGGGSFCAGGTGIAVGLDGSDTGVSYTVYNGTAIVAGPVTGTFSALSFGSFTTGGTYTVVASNSTTACVSTMNGSATVIVNSLPVVFPITGGGSYCSGGSGEHIILGGSTLGINYQLYYDGVSTGAAIPGNGTTLDFGLETGFGTYTAIAIDPSTGCTSSMSGSTVVAINPLPALYTVTGGGTYCSGGTGYHIGLSGSVSGTTYQLYRSGSITGTSLSGTGFGLDFGIFTTAGTYTVVATITATGCTRTMAGSPAIVVNSLPAAFIVTGGGSYCPGGSGFHVGLSGSVTGVRYQLYRGTTPVGSYITGTGGVLDLGLEATAGTYTVIATNTTTSCTSNMTGSATIIVNTLPTSYTVTGGGNYCAGSGGSDVGLSGSDATVSYQLYVGGAATGSAITGTGSALDFGLMTTTGTYTVVATNTSSCTATMLSSVSVTTSPVPTAYTVTGGGSSCSGGTPYHIGLSGSQVGVSYVLYNGTSVSSVSGTGAAIDFGTFTTIGTYTVVATNTGTSCTSTMAGSATISIASALTLYTVSGGGTYCAGGTGFHVYLSGSASGTNYQLYRGTSPVGSAVAGTGASLDFGVQTTAGGYNVIASNPTTGCSRSMTSSATIAVNALPTAYTVTGGGSYCTGGFGVHVGLSGSAGGIHYQLYRGGTTPVGGVVTGTGFALDFGLQASAGVYTIVASNVFTTCTSNMAGSATVTILALPSAGAISGLSSVATGATITLTESVTGGTWSTPAGGHVTVVSTTGVVTGVSAGSSVVSYTVSNTCGSAYATHTVTETGASHRNFPAGTTEICAGSSEILPNTATNGIWSSDDNNIATVDAVSGLVTGVSAGTTTVSYTVTDLSGSATSTVTTIVVNALPDALVINSDPGTAVKAGQRVSLTASVSNNSPVLAYQWLVNATVIPASNNATYTSSNFADNDVVTCSVIGLCGNTMLEKSIKVTITTNAIQQLTGTGDIRVVPNPNNGIFTIKGTLGTTADEAVTLEISDVLGQVIFSTNVTAVGGELNEKVQLGKTIPNGMYLLNVKTGTQRQVFHVIVEQ